MFFSLARLIAASAVFASVASSLPLSGVHATRNIEHESFLEFEELHELGKHFMAHGAELKHEGYLGAQSASTTTQSLSQTESSQPQPTASGTSRSAVIAPATHGGAVSSHAMYMPTAGEKARIGGYSRPDPTANDADDDSQEADDDNEDVDDSDDAV